MTRISSLAAGGTGCAGSYRVARCALLALGALAAAGAGNVQAATRQQAQAQIAQFRAAAKRRLVPGAVDTMPPVLQSISVAGTVNAAKAGQSITVTLNATDDVSGVYGIVIVLASPDGQDYIVQDFYDAIPEQNYTISELMGIPRYANPVGEFDIGTSPGEWSVYEVDIADVAGNSVAYDQVALAALGRTDFTVTNSYYSTKAPKLLGGSILTPTISLATPPAGTAAGTLPFAEMDVKASYAVTEKIAGIDAVSATFCMPSNINNGCTDSFGVTGQTGLPLQKPGTIGLSNQLTSTANPGSKVQTGTYYLYSVILEGTLFGVTSYTDAMFGGAVNLSHYFGQTTITVTP